MSARLSSSGSGGRRPHPPTNKGRVSPLCAADVRGCELGALPRSARKLLFLVFVPSKRQTSSLLLCYWRCRAGAPESIIAICLLQPTGYCKSPSRTPAGLPVCLADSCRRGATGASSQHPPPAIFHTQKNQRGVRPSFKPAPPPRQRVSRPPAQGPRICRVVQHTSARPKIPPRLRAGFRARAAKRAGVAAAPARRHEARSRPDPPHKHPCILPATIPHPRSPPPQNCG